MTVAAKTVIVTGANRGIGLAICQLILSRPEPLRLFATTRKGEDLGLSASSANPGHEVHYPKLDIASQQSIRSFAQHVTSRAQAVDVLINNAGVNLDAHYSPATARHTLDVNYRGTLAMCHAFLPLLSPHARLVNLSSVASRLEAYSAAIQQRFRHAHLTLDELEQLAQDFEHAVERGREAERGFAGPARAYAFSKACVNGLTAILARRHGARDLGRPAPLSINACCPGWVATEMGFLAGRAPKKPVDGARIPVHIGFEDIGGVTGRYWANDGVRSSDVGKVQEW